MADKKSDGAPADAERNSLRQARPREQKRVPAASTERPANAIPVNAIARAPSRQAAAATAPPGPIRRPDDPASPGASRSKVSEPKATEEPRDPEGMPEHIRRRFVQVGRKYYFPDGARAFTDRGRRLTTASENTEVVKSLVEIAKARGWNEISVHGSERFRREAWMTATMAGLEVRGYRPSKFEESKLVRMLADRTSPERRAAPLPLAPAGATEAKDTGPTRYTGKLLEHGRASYRQDPKEAMSYFVRLETARGERTIWGVDLERAFKESITQPKTGDLVGLVPARRDAVRINVPERDAEGKVSGQKSLDGHRNRWVVEKEQFFEGRAKAARVLLDSAVRPQQAVKDHPELIGTYLQVKAAELAAQKLRSPNDRQLFLERVRSSLAESVARGEPLPTVRMKTKAPPRRAPRAAEQAQAR